MWTDERVEGKNESMEAKLRWQVVTLCCIPELEAQESRAVLVGLTGGGYYRLMQQVPHTAWLKQHTCAITRYRGWKVMEVPFLLGY